LAAGRPKVRGGSKARKGADILVLHGPNLNLLGRREPATYGTVSLGEINKALVALAGAAGYGVKAFQSNHEGELIDLIQAHGPKAAGALVNAASLTHTSIGLRDAFLGVGIPLVEVHLSNVHRREDFRQDSFLSDIAVGCVVGFGATSYTLGLTGLIEHLKARDN
jgi:3-dehydroquinate dehydratase II